MPFKLLDDDKEYLEILKQNKTFVKKEQAPPSAMKNDEEEDKSEEEVEEKGWMGPRGSERDKMDARTYGGGGGGYVSGGPSDIEARRQAYEKQRDKWNEQEMPKKPITTPEEEEAEE